MSYAPVARRIEALVALGPSACWPWSGCLDRHGYGKVNTGSPKRSLLAHRLVYERLVGPIPIGLQLDHLCRNRACVNPAHLEPVTGKENIRRSDLVGKHLALATICRNGHPRTSESTAIRRGRDGQEWNTCRLCATDRMRRWKAKSAA